MIRRDTIDPHGQQRWSLIGQVAHAQLAGKLAERWQLDQLLPAQVREEWLSAVFHHDDGWADWDREPGWDAQTGRPLSFTEMPTAVATGIWRRSIESAAAIGPLAAYVVTGHFAALLRRFSHWRQGDAQQRQAAEDFLAFAEHKMAVSVASWQELATGHTLALAELCLELLRMFDALSLWFCCAARSESETIAVPNSSAVTFRPVAPDRVVALPWPFGGSPLKLQVSTISIPAVARCGADVSIIKAGHHEILQWLVEPAESPS